MTDRPFVTSGPATDKTRWDRFFLRIARECASMSKDPSTKVGAVIVRPNRTIVSTGWNGFARGLDDDPALYADRSYKMRTVVHAEANALVMARESLDGYPVYTTGLPPCPSCAALVIQSGIRRVVTEMDPFPDRWIEDIRLSVTQLLKASVDVHFIDAENRLCYEAIRQPKHAENGIVLHRVGVFDDGILI